MDQSLPRNPRAEQNRDTSGAKKSRSATTAEREALTARLRAKAADADGGRWTSLAGLTDDEIIAALSRR